jgi:hypothetical protein
VRPHEPLILAEYQKLMTSLMVRLHQMCSPGQPSAQTQGQNGRAT